MSHTFTHGHSAHTQHICTNVSNQARTRSHVQAVSGRCFPTEARDVKPRPGTPLSAPARGRRTHRDVRASRHTRHGLRVSRCHPHCSRGRGALHPQGGHRGARLGPRDDGVLGARARRVHDGGEARAARSLAHHGHLVRNRGRGRVRG